MPSFWRRTSMMIGCAVAAGCSDLDLGAAEHFASGFEREASEWTAQSDGYTGGAYSLRNGEVDFLSSPVRSGQRAMRARLPGAPEQQEHAAITRTGPYPPRAFYSAHFYLPRRYDPGVFWHLLQFRSRTTNADDSGASDVHWGLQVERDTDGSLFLSLVQQLPVSRWTYFPPTRKIPLPIERWFHIEVELRKRTTEDGALVVWQDGAAVAEARGVRTDGNGSIMWLVGSVGQDVSPAPVDVFVDDAVVSVLPLHGR